MHGFLHIVSGDGPHLIALADVVEVLPMVWLDRGSEDGGPHYCGLLNYRGEVLPAFAVSDRDLEPREQPQWMLVVVRSETGSGAWVVRDVLGVLQVDSAQVSRPALGGARPVAVVEIDGALVRVLDRRPGG